MEERERERERERKAPSGASWVPDLVNNRQNKAGPEAGNEVPFDCLPHQRLSSRHVSR